jgi:hypothetical protein
MPYSVHIEFLIDQILKDLKNIDLTTFIADVEKYSKSKDEKEGN